MDGLFSGTDESAGDVVVKPDGSRVQLFYGLSSGVAMHKHAFVRGRVVQKGTASKMLLAASWPLWHTQWKWMRWESCTFNLAKLPLYLPVSTLVDP